MQTSGSSGCRRWWIWPANESRAARKTDSAVNFSIKKPKGLLWRTNLSFEDIQSWVANGKAAGDWLVCPVGEASRAVAVSEFLDDPSILAAAATPVQPPAGSDEEATVPAPSIPRRQDLDALRAFAMLLGIALHAGLTYMTVQFWLWPVSDERTHFAFDVMYSAVHGFRMPLFFMVSGFFTAMLWRKRGLSALIKQRSKRVLLPLLVFLVPIQMLAIGVVILVVWLEAGSQTGKESIWEAAKSNDAQELERLLEGDVDIDRPDPTFQMAPLHWAALNGSRDALELLIERDADIEVGSRDGSTPLNYAAFMGRQELVSLLIEKDARINSVTDSMETPLDRALADESLVKMAVALFKIRYEPKGLADRREKCAEILRKYGAKRYSELGSQPDAESFGEVEPFNGLTAKYREFIRWRGFHQPMIFGHLWFLYFLCILIIPFAIFALIADRCKWTGPPRWMIRFPVVLVWLVPLTMIPLWFNGLTFPGFGPDTSGALIPMPHVLALYGLFMFFGALYFDCDDQEGQLGRYWWLSLPLALLVVFPLGLAVSKGSGLDWLPLPAERPVSVFAQALYPWLMTFGLIGLFRRICVGENRIIRYVSDSSYWLYLAHLPLLIPLLALLKPLGLHSFVKFSIVCAVAVGILLASYEFMVRYTWIGAMLNGKRRRSVIPVNTAVDQAR